MIAYNVNESETDRLKAIVEANRSKAGIIREFISHLTGGKLGQGKS
jgi:hypothetical protein